MRTKKIKNAERDEKFDWGESLMGRSEVYRRTRLTGTLLHAARARRRHLNEEDMMLSYRRGDGPERMAGYRALAPLDYIG